MGNSENFSLRERKRQQTRQKIQSTALHLAETKGISGFTIEELAAEAGISRRTFFNYFPSKEDALLNSQSDFLAEEFKEKYLGGKYEEAESFVEELLLMFQDSANKLAESFSPENFSRLTTLFSQEPKLVTSLFDRLEKERAELQELIGKKYPDLPPQDQRLLSDIAMRIHQFTLISTLEEDKPISQDSLSDAYAQFKLFTFNKRSEILEKKKER